MSSPNQAARRGEVGATIEFVSKMPDSAAQRHGVGDLVTTVVIKIIVQCVDKVDGEIALDRREMMRDASF